MIAVFIQTGPWGRSHSIPVYKCLFGGLRSRVGVRTSLTASFNRRWPTGFNFALPWRRSRSTCWFLSAQQTCNVIGPPQQHSQATDPDKDSHCRLENEGQSFTFGRLDGMDVFNYFPMYWTTVPWLLNKTHALTIKSLDTFIICSFVLTYAFLYKTIISIKHLEMDELHWINRQQVYVQNTWEPL